ncbi:MAG: hypothetical protein ACRCYY_03540 [Trueperaceae bacterium]
MDLKPKDTFTLSELETFSADDLAEQFKTSNLEIRVEPLSEWGSDVETLVQKLEKSVMLWYETGTQRSLTLCFQDEAVDIAAREATGKPPVLAS